MSERILDRVLDQLSGVRKLHDGSHMALCPCHDDHKPSLHLSILGGRLVAYCFACGARTKDILQAVGIELPDTKIAVAQYNYTDEDGNLLFQKVRFEPKDFRLRRPLPGGGWAYDLKGTRRVLYRLPDLIRADTVWIVEGEKDADRLAREGLAATTNFDGAGKWDPTYTEFLRGKDVVIVPDNDEAGRNHAELVALSIWPAVNTIKIVHLPGLPEGGDVYDYLVNHTIEDFLAIVEQTPPWSPAPVKQANVEVRGPNARISFPEQGVTLICQRLKLHSDGKLTCVLKAMVGGYKIPGSGVINLAAPTTRRNHARALGEIVSIPWNDILEVAYCKLTEALLEGEPAVPIRPSPKTSHPYIVSGFLPEGMETLLWGPGGAGKSWLALALAYHVFTGEPFLGKKIIKTGCTLYLDWETNQQEISRRLHLLLGDDSNSLFEQDFLYYKRLDLPLADSLDAIYGIITEVNPVFVVIDSMARAIGGNMLEEESVSSFFSSVRSMGRTALIIHHPTKAVLNRGQESTFYGSAYTLWMPRSVWKLDTRLALDGQTIAGILTQVKTNIGRKQPPIAFKMRIEPWELVPASLDEVRGNMPISDRIKSLLQRKGKLTTQEIANELDLTPDTTRRTLNRLKTKSLVDKDDEGFWYIPVEIPF